MQIRLLFVLRQRKTGFLRVMHRPSESVCRSRWMPLRSTIFDSLLRSRGLWSLIRKVVMTIVRLFSILTLQPRNEKDDRNPNAEPEDKLAVVGVGSGRSLTGLRLLGR